MSSDPASPPPPAPAPPAPPGTPPPSGPDLFDRIRAFGMVRPDDGRWAAGVCAAVARRTGIDPLLVRGLLVALTLTSGGAALLCYGLAWALLPQQDGSIHVQQLLRGQVRAGLVGAAIVAVIGLGRPAPWWLVGWTPWGGGSGGGLLVLLLVGLGVWWLANRARTQPDGPTGAPGHGNRGHGNLGHGTPGYGAPGHGSPGYGSTPAPPGPSWGATGSSGGTMTYAPAPTQPLADPGPSSSPPGQGDPAQGGSAPGYSSYTYTAPPQVDLTAPSHRLTLATLGSALLAAGGFAIWDRSGPGLPGPTALVAGCAALAVVAIGIVVAGVLGLRSGGLAPIGVLLAVAVIVGALVSPWVNLKGAGQRDWRPTSVAEAEAGYQLGAGQLEADLTRPGLISAATASDPVRIETSIGLGELDLLVPQGVAVQVEAELGAGELRYDATAPGESGIQESGNHVVRTIRIGTGDPVVVVHAKVGLGTIVVQDA